MTTGERGLPWTEQSHSRHHRPATRRAHACPRSPGSFWASETRPWPLQPLKTGTGSGGHRRQPQSRLAASCRPVCPPWAPCSLHGHPEEPPESRGHTLSACPSLGPRPDCARRAGPWGLSQQRAVLLGLLWQRPGRSACRGGAGALGWGHGRPRHEPGPGSSPPGLSPQMGLSRAAKGWVGAGAPVKLGAGGWGLDMRQVQASPSDTARGLCRGAPSPLQPASWLGSTSCLWDSSTVPRSPCAPSPEACPWGPRQRAAPGACGVRSPAPQQARTHGHGWPAALGERPQDSGSRHHHQKTPLDSDT